MNNSVKYTNNPNNKAKSRIIFDKNDIDSEKDIFYLVWTTTPWTLPCNMALCVNSNIEYSLIEYDDTQYVVGTKLISDIFGNGKKKKVPDELKVISKFIYLLD